MSMTPGSGKLNPGAILRRNRDSILEEWEKRVRHAVPAAKHRARLFLQDELRVFLDVLADALSGDQQRTAVVSRKHTAQTSGADDVTLAAVLTEYQLLHGAILDDLDREEALGKVEISIIQNALHAAIQSAVSAFTNVHHMTELAAERDLLNAILDNVAEGVVACDADGRLTMFNKATREFHGLPESPVPPEQWANHYSLFEADGCTPLQMESIPLFRALAGEAVQDAEMVISPTHGPARQILASGRAIMRADGSNGGAVVTMRDISAFKAAELGRQNLARERLEREQEAITIRASEAYFRALVDDAPVMIWLLDSAGECTFVNRQWRESTGQTMAQALGFGWLNAVHPDDAEPSGEIVRAAAEKGIGFRLECRLRRNDGVYRWAIDLGEPRLGEMGEVEGYIGSVIDIHERKVAEDDREVLLASERRSRAEAERLLRHLTEADRRKDEFLAVLSHELRSPLNVIGGHAELLRLEEPGSQDFQDSIDAIARNTKLQTQLIGDLLDVSRIITGKLMLELTSFAAEAILFAAADAIRFAAESKGVRLEIQIQEDGLGTIVGDATRLQQIFWNLLSNAVKFTAKGGSVRLVARRVESHVEFRVEDSGQGISADFLPHVFDRFHQEDASKTRQYGGLGLGLAIVRHLTELHGGTVQAHSSGKGSGATFTVMLPVKALRVDDDSTEDSLAAKATDRDTTPSQGIALPLAGLAIIVADDQADARDLLVKLLLRFGATSVTAAESATQCLDLLDRQRPDLLVSDIGMPEMNGFELIKEWRSRERQRSLPPIPAIALTAYATERDRDEALTAGFQAHLTKPVRISELTEAIVALRNGGFP